MTSPMVDTVIVRDENLVQLLAASRFAFARLTDPSKYYNTKDRAAAEQLKAALEPYGRINHPLVNSCGGQETSADS